MEVMPHLKLRDDLGIPYAILPGDPARVERIAEQLEDVEELEFNREYKSIAGTYKGIRVLAVSTGIGGPSTGIAVEELARIGVTHAIRIGSCGALQKEIRLGDLILVQGAVRDEGTSRTYIDSIYPAIPDFELMNACVEAAEGSRFRRMSEWHGVMTVFTRTERTRSTHCGPAEECLAVIWRQRRCL